MSKSLRLLALGGLTSLWAAAAVAHGPYIPPGHPWPPSGLVRVSAGGEKLTLWPYTTSDFKTPSDPINLVFPNADPREIRQVLMKLDGARSLPQLAGLPFADCRWTDAMGYEQAAYHVDRWRGDWAGGVVQLACVHGEAPLGDPFRFHIRLFRAGKHTVGNAHFEILIPGTAEHEVLSWDFARDFAAYDMGETKTVVAPPQQVGMIPAGSFRAVRRAVYEELVKYDSGALIPLLAYLNLYPAPGTGDVPIPTNGKAAALVTAIDFEPSRTHVVTTTQVEYTIDAPKPFCSTGPYDFVKLEAPIQFTLSVSTGPSGRYERTYTVGGTLSATPEVPTSPTTFVPVGPTVPASVFEVHQATMDNRNEQVTERTQQSLLGDPFQSMAWSFAAGDTDSYVRNVVCSAE